MMKWVIAAGFVLAAPFSASAQDAAAGKELFKKLTCSTCHQIGPDAKNLAGPQLNCVVGRAAGSVEGYTYSAGLKGAGLTWDEATLDKWITNPKAVVAGTKMIFNRKTEAADRANLIAYLKSECPG
jgi:cytochrome c